MADSTTFSGRGEDLAILPQRIGRHEPVHLLIDSTGLKIYGEGEWLDQKYGIRERRRWRKCSATIWMRTPVNQDEKNLTAMSRRVACRDLVARGNFKLIDAARQSGRCFGGLPGGGSTWSSFSLDCDAAPVAFDVHFQNCGVVNEAIYGG